MTSEIRVNKIENRSGLGTVTFADTGVDLAGIVTATTFSGSGASLTALPAAQVTGTLPAISGANLTTLNGSNIASGTVADARISTLTASKLSGALPAISALNLTNVPAANVVGVHTSLNITGSTTVGAAVTISSDGIDAVGVAITCATLNGGAFSNRRININGDMSVWQYSSYAGTSALSVASGTQITNSLDNMLWRAAGTGGTGAFSVVQEAVTDLPEFYYCAKLLCTTADTAIAAGAYHTFWPVAIEGLDANRLMWGTSNAKNIVYSFYVKSNKTGSYGGSVGNYGNNRSFPFNYTINSANTWERKVIKVPGDTTGTYVRNNAGSIKVTMSLGTGSNYTGTANQWNAAEDMAPTSHVNWMDSTSNNYYITGVQFEEGDEMTPFEHRHFNEELLLCQRYFQAIVGYGGKAGSHMYVNGYSTNTIEIMPDYRVPMRATPSIGSYGQWQARSGAGADLDANLAGATFSGNAYGQSGHFWVTESTASDWTAFSTIRVSATSGTNTAWEISSKMF